VAALSALWVCGHPAGTALLRWGLARDFRSIGDAASAHDAGAIVVLAGGLWSYDIGGRSVTALPDTTALRVLEGARLHALLGGALPLVASGGGNLERQSTSEASVMRDTLIRLGVAPDRIVVEAGSSSTREQAQAVARLLGERGIRRIVLVTSGWHLWRAAGAFRAAGLDPVPSAAPDHGDRRPATWRLLPTVGALRDSSFAVREYLALAYYWSRGWLAPAARTDPESSAAPRPTVQRDLTSSDVARASGQGDAAPPPASHRLPVRVRAPMGAQSR
jgi:uncharacterized SAM-binding protein YcdF (DUF218 family)